ncbi:MAG TPA: hypothetical protein VGN97_02740 [Mesorhizobium sp.]|jgi:hypothetical protein|nr:hypothetical protein [Mesorhizobium sp.]
MRLATGEIEEGALVDDGKDPAAKAFGANGGKKRAENMTPERRVEIAKKAAGVTDKLWSMDDLCRMINAVAPKPGPRGPYKKRAP